MGLERAACLALVLGACSFRPGSFTTDGDVGDVGPVIDMTVVPVCTDNVCTLRFDTDAEWRDAELLRDGLIEGAALAPGAYVYGALVARGSNTAYGTTSVDWAGIDTATVAGTTLAFPVLPVTQMPPRGTSITDNGDWTYWIEGELALTAGTHAIELVGVDIASLQLAQPGTRTFATVANASLGAPQVVTFDAGAGGWFPMRVAVVQTDGGDAGMIVRVGADATTLGRITRSQMRARVDGMRGALLFAWDDRRMAGRMTPSLYTRPLIADEIDAPLAPGLTSADNLTQRWTAQIYADVAGDYTLGATSDDGNRVFLAAQASGDELESVGPAIMTTVTTTLRRGWNDLAVDFIEEGGAESMQLALTAAPSGVALGTIPVAQVRPVFPRGHRFVSQVDRPQRNIPNNNTAGISETFTVDVLPGETVREVRVAYVLNHGQLGELDVELQHGGMTAILRNGSNSANRWHQPTLFDGMDPAGAWTLRVDDESGGTTGSLDAWTLTVLTQGGPGHVSERTEWISTVKDLGALGTVTALQSLQASLVAAPGASVEAYVRTCATPEACAAEPWSGPIASGAAVPAPPRRYAQLRAVLVSNGIDDPTVDAIELVYRVMP